MADSFLDGAVPLDGFIDEYQSKRKLAHLRRVKIEKLQELALKSPAVVLVPRHTEPVSTPAPPQREPDSTPTPLPRRAPPLPPIKNNSAQSLLAPVLAYPAAPYPPIPPRVRQPQPGYPSLCMPQYPPPVPQRSAPSMAPQPGFILQWPSDLFIHLRSSNLCTGFPAVPSWTSSCTRTSRKDMLGVSKWGLSRHFYSVKSSVSSGTFCFNSHFRLFFFFWHWELIQDVWLPCILLLTLCVPWLC